MRWIIRLCWCAAGSTDRWERYQFLCWSRPSQKHSFSRCSSNLPTWEGYQFLRWSRPIWKLLVRTHKGIHFHDEAATYHITFAIISCRKRAECCHRRGMLRLHVCPTIQPAIPAIYHTVGVFVHAEGRAEQSQTAYNAGTIANTSDNIDYSIGRSMNRLWLRLRGTALHTSTSWFVWCIASCTIMLYILTGQESAGEEREVT